MKSGIKVVATLAGGIAGSVLTALFIGKKLWNYSAFRARERLLSGVPVAGDRLYFPDHFAELPEPVARFFETVLSPGQPIIHRVRIEQEGMFRAGDFNTPWSPFTAVQLFSACPPGFVWEASIRMAPLLTVRVRDSYTYGTASMHGKIASLLTVVKQQGTPELNAGTLHRFLAEAVWFPTALLPGRRLSWEGMDDHHARATLADADTSVSLEFQFGEKGEIIRAYTPQRYRDVEGTAVPTPWECLYRDYQVFQGVKIPMEGEVAWMLPEGRLPYWKGRIVDVNFEFV